RAARREAAGAFGDERLIVERYVERARHIEVQVIADRHGAVLHLGERECSLQRRHQKVVEEAPSPVVDDELRRTLGAAAIALARRCSYTNAGTVELIVERDAPKRFSFLEMNARLQVEHPVTEAVTGLDLVELQLRVAAGEPLPLTQEQVRVQGHAIEARVYAEDPAAGFLPAGGRVVAFTAPEGLRFDGAVRTGLRVGTDYDSMLGKTIAHAPTRTQALRRLRLGLERAQLVGPETNLAWLRALLARQEVRDGELDTTLLERLAGELAAPATDPDLLAGLAVVALLGAGESRHAADDAPVDAAREARDPASDPWAARDGWRLGGTREPATILLQLGHAGSAQAVAGSATPLGDGSWQVGDASSQVGASLVEPGAHGLRVRTADGETRTVAVHRDREAVWIVDRGAPVRCAPAVRSADGALGGGSLQAPMPGTVIEVRVAPGDRVAAGAPLLVLESMKMELTIASPSHGVVRSLRAAVGDRVAQGQLLLELDEDSDDEPRSGRESTACGLAADPTQQSTP
ncbi:MAG: ATP-binding protein, partial [Solirubrobacteraceae bacterium]